MLNTTCCRKSSRLPPYLRFVTRWDHLTCVWLRLRVCAISLLSQQAPLLRQRPHGIAPMIVLAFILMGLAEIARGQDQPQTTLTRSGTKTDLLMTTTPLARLPRPETESDRPAPLVNQNTCGYTSGNWQSGITCAGTDSCTYQTTPYSAPFFGCCSQGVSGTNPGCTYLSTCLDYGASSNTNTGNRVLIDESVGYLW